MLTRVESSPPAKDLKKDWPKISEKPIDHPFGPYSDSFTEEQHKYGPFKPIQETANRVIVTHVTKEKLHLSKFA